MKRIVLVTYILVVQFTVLPQTNAEVFQMSNKTLTHIHDVLEGFNQAITKNYKNLMPNVSEKVGNEVNELLQEINELTDNKRVLDQTRSRYRLYLENAQNEIDSSIEQIVAELNVVKSSSIKISSRLFEAAQLLEVELREKSCTDDEVIDFFKPYMNQTVECIRRAITVDSHYEKNARTVADAIVSILNNVVTSLRICTNKGSRVALCSQRVSCEQYLKFVSVLFSFFILFNRMD